jgi:hypothetical protein
MNKPSKPRHEMTLEEMIAASGWFSGTSEDWQALPLPEREERAFAATGCMVAWPTWAVPVNCHHMRCMIGRGDLPRIAETNWVLRHERSSRWLRFITDRSKVARIFRAYRLRARETGIYDPWKSGGMGLVLAGLQD